MLNCWGRNIEILFIVIHGQKLSINPHLLCELYMYVILDICNSFPFIYCTKGFHELSTVEPKFLPLAEIQTYTDSNSDQSLHFAPNS